MDTRRWVVAWAVGIDITPFAPGHHVYMHSWPQQSLFLAVWFMEFGKRHPTRRRFVVACWGDGTVRMLRMGYSFGASALRAVSVKRTPAAVAVALRAMAPEHEKTARQRIVVVAWQSVGQRLLVGRRMPPASGPTWPIGPSQSCQLPSWQCPYPSLSSFVPGCRK